MSLKNSVERTSLNADEVTRKSSRKKSEDIAAIQAIISDPVSAKRRAKAKKRKKVTSNQTIAAAVMVAAALLAVCVANTDAYFAIHHVLLTPLTLGIGNFVLELSLEAFINDFLMAIFFLLVGIELKYEMVVGQLRRPRQAALPMLAAVGGVVVPALIYLAFNAGSAPHGWAIPIATDIAFALGVMSLLGDKISPQTKVFFQTLAIADDILAILVLALFYGQTPNISWLALTGVVLVILGVMAHARVYSAKPYLLVGLVLWFCMFNSGIHATLAGVLLAFFLPARSDIRLSEVGVWLKSKAHKLGDAYDDDAHILGQHSVTQNAYQVERIMHHVTPPLERVERTISVPVNFVILPLFAFVNAQVRLVDVDLMSVLADPVTLGAYFGAVVGKPVGIILVTWILVKIGFAKLPAKVGFDQIVAVGLMGGMGFTMSILIASLAFPNPAEVTAAKVAILAGTLTAALLGILFVNIHHAIRHKSK